MNSDTKDCDHPFVWRSLDHYYCTKCGVKFMLEVINNGKMEKCPKCGEHAVIYDEYYGRKICKIRICGWEDMPKQKSYEMTLANHQRHSATQRRG